MRKLKTAACLAAPGWILLWALLAGPCAPSLPAQATPLHPQLASTGTTALLFQWDSLPSSSFIVVFSTEAGLSPYLSSSTLGAGISSQLYSSLAVNTTYYFAVKISTDPDAAYALNTATGATLASTPTAVNVSFPGASSLRVNWNTDSNPADTLYAVELSSGPFENTFTGNVSLVSAYNGSALVGGLLSNTTYYARAGAINRQGAATSFSAPVTGVTLAQRVTVTGAVISSYGASVSWLPFPASPPADPSLSCEGFLLELSLYPSFVSILSSSTADAAAAALTVGGLAANTTYYYRVGTLNWAGTADYTAAGSFMTLTPPLQNLGVSAMYLSSATLNWTPFPAFPPSASASGYVLEGSTTNFDGTGDIVSSATYDVTSSALTLDFLFSNTTWYFRVGALNGAGSAVYTAPVSSVTLGENADPNSLGADLWVSSITLTWTPLAPAPWYVSCEGFRLEASSVPFNWSSVIISSTPDPQAGSLSITGLFPDTTYYLRLASLNWTLTPNFQEPGWVKTLQGPPLSSPSVSFVGFSSIAVSWNPGENNGYVLEASSSPSGVVFSSFSPSAQTASLAITGLEANTVYSLRAGPVYNGATNYTLLGPYSTLAQPQGGVSLAAVYPSSISFVWTPLPLSPQSAASEGYIISVYASPDFTGIPVSSATSVPSVGGLTVPGLTPNTTYFMRAGSLNWDRRPAWSAIPPGSESTATLANIPLEAAPAASQTAITVNWLANSNPPDTEYLAEMSTDETHSPLLAGVLTVNTSATFSSLQVNTSHYFRVCSFNRGGKESCQANFSTLATLAREPGHSPFTTVGISSVTANWAGNNPFGTVYSVVLSTNPDLSPPDLTAATPQVYAVFSGLSSNTTYYGGVTAANLGGIPTLETPLGGILTYPAPPGPPDPATPVFTDIMLDALTVNWSANGNSTMTVYETEVSTDAVFSVPAASSALVQTFSRFTGLQRGTTYYARVRAVDALSRRSPFVVFGSTATLLFGQETINPATANTVVLKTSFGDISVYVPPSAFGGSLTMRIEQAPSLPSARSSGAELLPTGIGITIEVTPALQPLKPITITVSYRDSDIAYAARPRLVLAFYSPYDNVWVPVPSSSDPPGRKVTGQAWHLSTFQIMSSAAQTSLDKARIYPNPFLPSSGHTLVQFSNLTPNASVRIFTFLGELARDIKADGNGVATWDGLSNWSGKVASGVYIVLIENQDKSQKKIMKLAIER